MTSRVFLGMLTPSSNTILEPVTTAMIAGLPEVTAHFSRFKVTEIALSGPALAQFDDCEILRAAELLAHAKVERDRLERHVVRLARLRARRAAVRADHAGDRDRGLHRDAGAERTVARSTGAKRVGFVTPYLDDVQARINANYEKAGFDGRGRPASRHAGQFLVLGGHRRPDARDDARRRGRQAGRDRDRLHQHARRAARRGARGSARHSGLRHGVDDGVEEPEDRRRGHRRVEGWGRLFDV